jgi:hypothetical protein
VGFYIPEDDIIHGDCREHLKPYISDPIPFRELRSKFAYSATITSWGQVATVLTRFCTQEGSKHD